MGVYGWYKLRYIYCYNSDLVTHYKGKNTIIIYNDELRQNSVVIII